MCPESTRAVELQLIGRSAVVTLDNPPVNGLSLAVRSALMQTLQELQDDSRVESIVLRGADRGFSAGGDIHELGTPASSQTPGLSAHVHPAIERSRQPVIAALHGFCIGGALETALACHYRIAHADTRLALPEVQLGILPLSGTQRAPRVLDFKRVVELILEGRPYQAWELSSSALIDRMVGAGADLLQSALDFARDIAGQAPPPLIRSRALVSTPGLQELARTRAAYATAAPAVRLAFEAIAAAYESPDFDSGMARARQLYESLESNPALRVTRDRFLASGGSAREGTP